jgi:hypothetical protein
VIVLYCEYEVTVLAPWVVNVGKVCEVIITGRVAFIALEWIWQGFGLPAGINATRVGIGHYDSDKQADSYGCNFEMHSDILLRESRSKV